jgi:hypothetical protein
MKHIADPEQVEREILHPIRRMILLANDGPTTFPCPSCTGGPPPVYGPVAITCRQDHNGIFWGGPCPNCEPGQRLVNGRRVAAMKDIERHDRAERVRTARRNPLHSDIDETEPPF